MAETFAGFEDLTSAELSDLLGLQQELQRFQLEESGLVRDPGGIGLEDALQKLSPARRQEFERQNRELNEFELILQQQRAAGFGDDKHITVTTPSGVGFSSSVGALETEVTKRRQAVQGLEERITTTFAKTPERKAQEEAAKRFETLQTKQFELQLGIQQRQMEQMEKLQPLYEAAQERQAGILEAQQTRQAEALAGQGEASAALKKQQEDQFQQLKETAGRRGIDIKGETLEDATSESSAGIQMLSQLRTRFDISRQQEQQAILGEAPIVQQGMGQFGQLAAFGLQPQIGSFAAQAPGISGVGPGMPSGMGLQAIQQAMFPTITSQNLLFQQQAQGAQQRMFKKERHSGLLGAGMAASGDIISALIPGLPFMK